MGTLVAGDLIRSARDEHPTFNSRRHTNAVLLRMLSRYQKQLFAKVIMLDPSQGVDYFDQALPLADFDAGITIPAYKYPLGVQVTRVNSTARPHPIDLVSWAMSSRYRHAAYLLNGKLFLCGKAHDWTSFASVRFLYVAEASPITLDVDAMSTVLTVIPDAGEDCLVAYLAMKMATRGGAADGETKPDPGSFAAGWTLAEERFLDEMGRNTQAVASTVREAD